MSASRPDLPSRSLQVVAFTLAPAEIKKLRDQFKAFDTDGSGTLSLSEFRQAMEKHAGMDSKSIADLFSKVYPKLFAVAFCGYRPLSPWLECGHRSTLTTLG